MATGTLDERIRAVALQHGISPEAASRMLKDKLGIGIFNQLTASTVDPRRQSNRRPMQYPRAPTEPSYTGGGVKSSPGWGSSVREMGQEVKDWGAGIGNSMKEMIGIEPASATTYEKQGLYEDIKGFGEYGGVPLGVRLATLGGILSNYGNFDPRMLSPLVAAKEANAAKKEQARKQQMADRIADNLQDTNPQLADAIRMNPALVEDYAKGQIDLEKTLQIDANKEDYNIADDEREAAAALKLEGKEQEGRMALEGYKTENDPDTIAARAWQNKVSTFGGDISTLDLYKKITKDKNLDPTEAEALAGSLNEKDFWDRYNQIKDNRNEGKKTEAATTAAALAGIKLAEGDYIVNQKEIIEASAKGLPIPEPIVKPIQGTKRAVEMDIAAEAEASRDESEAETADVMLGAIDRVFAGIERQKKGESATGVGTLSSIVGGLPIASEAGDIYDDLQIMRTNLGLDRIQQMRDESPTGGTGLGSITDYENRMLQSAFEVLNQARDPEVLKARLGRLRARYEAVMTKSQADPSKSVMVHDVEMLRKDPSKAALFDEVYGEGASKTVLGN